MTSRPYKLGVMQGRLLPKYKERYQAHPVGYWQKEFSIAADLGLDLIEFILDLNDINANPLMSEVGIDEILEVSNKAGISVQSVCADCFMEVSLHSRSEEESILASQILDNLIKRVGRLGVTDIVIPCVDASSLQSEGSTDRLVEKLGRHGDLAGQDGLRLCLETDLGPGPFSELLGRLESSVFTVNYDIGNSVALGYDPKDELAAYGNRISDIHIKDRLKGGGSVELGMGNADFEAFASLGHDYSGYFIMQAFRDDEGVAVFRRQLDWIRPLVETWAAGKQK